MRSNSGIRSDLLKRSLNDTLVTDFFGGVAQVQVTDDEAGVLDAAEHPLEQRENHSHHPIFGVDVENVTLGEGVESAKQSALYLRKQSPQQSTSSIVSLRAWGGVAVLGALVGLLSRSR